MISYRRHRLIIDERAVNRSETMLHVVDNFLLQYCLLHGRNLRKL